MEPSIIIQNLSLAFGWALFHSIWQLFLAVLLLWLLAKTKPFKDPKAKYTGGMLALLLLLISFIGTFFIYLNSNPASGLSFNNPNFSGRIISQMDEIYRPGYFATLSQNLDTQIKFLIPYLVNAWILGALFCMCRLLGGMSELKNLKARAQPLNNRILIKRAKALLHAMGIEKKVDLMISKDIDVPLTFGTVKPVILLPISLVFQLPVPYIEAVLAHEMAHIKRYDYSLNLFQSAMEVLFFYHPAFWWINELIKEAREQIADDLAINAGIPASDLAYGLAMVVNQASLDPPELSMAAHGNRFPTLNRILRILDSNKNIKYAPSPLIRKTMIITCLLSLSLFLGAAFHSTIDNVALATKISNAAVKSISPYSAPLKDTVNLRLPKPAPQPIPPLKPIVKPVLEKVTDKAEKDDTFDILVPFSNDSLPSIPKLNFSPPPVLEIDSLLQDPDRFETREFIQEIGDSIKIYTKKLVIIHSDSVPINSEEMEKLTEKIESLHQQMAAFHKEFEVEMEAWTKALAPEIKAFEEKMEVWRLENEPRLREFEKEMAVWAAKNAASFEELGKEFQQKEKEFKQKNFKNPDKID